MPVIVGTCLAYRHGFFEPLPALCYTLFTLFAEILANYSNDYFDFLKGADRKESRMGPKRALAEGWIRPEAMRKALFVVTGLAILSGAGLMVLISPWLVFIGLACLLGALAYTAGPYPLGYHGWGDAAVYVFFGWVALCTPYFIQTGSLGWDIFLTASTIGALVNNILVITSYRDREEDLRVNKRTLAVRFGRRFIQGQYLTQLMLGLLLPPILTLIDSAYAGTFLSLLALPLGLKAYKNIPHNKTLLDFNRGLMQSMFTLIAYSLLFCAGLFL